MIIKHLLLLTFLFFASATETKVYVCTGPQSECYHKKKDCRGLKNCSKDIREMTLEKAKNMGRRPCGYCYKKR